MLPASVESYGLNVFAAQELVLIFGRNNSLISKVIRARTWGDYSHVAPICPITDMVLEAKGGKDGGVIQTSIEDFSKRYDMVAIRYHPGDINVVRSHLGLGFDTKGLYGQFLHLNWQDPYKVFCAESVALASFIIDSEAAHKQNAQSLFITSSVSPLNILKGTAYVGSN